MSIDYWEESSKSSVKQLLRSKHLAEVVNREESFKVIYRSALQLRLGGEDGEALGLVPVLRLTLVLRGEDREGGSHCEDKKTVTELQDADEGDASISLAALTRIFMAYSKFAEGTVLRYATCCLKFRSIDSRSCARNHKTTICKSSAHISNSVLQ